VNRAVILSVRPSLGVLYTFYLHTLGWMVWGFDDHLKALNYLVDDQNIRVIFVNLSHPFDHDLDFVVESKQIAPDTMIVVISMLQHECHPTLTLLNITADAFMYMPQYREDFEAVLTELFPTFRW
jgi:hypothetical protein